MKRTISFLIIFLWTVIKIVAQDKPYEEDIQAFKKSDQINRPAKNSILFIGSSSFTKWHDVQEYFPGYPIINRAFGGSTLVDVTGYANDIIFPYHPKQIVIYCGDNDLANDTTVTAKIVLDRFQKLFQLIRKKQPSVSIVYVSIKPSPSRKKLMGEAQKANSLIQAYLKKQPQAYFVDVFHKMLNKDGSIMNDIFLEDQLHMNAKGYAIWQKAIQPYLKK